MQSVKCDEPANKLNLKLWQEADLIVSVLFRIKVMTIREFRGEQHELAFLQFFYQNARVLKHAAIVSANVRITGISDEQMFSIVQNMDDSRWARKFRLAILGSTGPEGGRPWMFQRGANFYDDDPFAPVKIIESGQYCFPSCFHACIDFIHVTAFLYVSLLSQDCSFYVVDVHKKNILTGASWSQKVAHHCLQFLGGSECSTKIVAPI